MDEVLSLSIIFFFDCTLIREENATYEIYIFYKIDEIIATMIDYEIIIKKIDISGEHTVPILNSQSWYRDIMVKHNTKQHNTIVIIVYFNLELISNAE